MSRAADPDRLLVVYGSLRSAAVRGRLGIAGRLRRLGPCSLRGYLYDLGDYPGFVHGEGLVRGELFAAADPQVLTILDDYEDIVPGRPQSSLYRRERVRLITPPIEAWVYVYNRPVAGRRRVPSGEWRP